MTSREFEEYWATNRGMTVEEVRAEGRVVLKCACGLPECRGWASLLKDQADTYINDLPGLYGYSYPTEGE